MKQRKDRRAFTIEFKKEIIAKAEAGVKVSELASQNGLTVQTIYSWRRQLRDQEIDAAVDRAPRVQQSGVNPKYVRDLEEKLRAANEKLGELYVVVDALKKMDPTSSKSASSSIVSGMPWGRLRGRAK